MKLYAGFWAHTGVPLCSISDAIQFVISDMLTGFPYITASRVELGTNLALMLSYDKLIS